MLKKQLVVASIGVPAGVHKLTSISVNLEAKNTTVAISSFYNEDAVTDNLASLATSSVTLDGIPATGQDIVDFAQGALIKAAPDGTTVNETITMYSTDRYAFQNATIE